MLTGKCELSYPVPCALDSTTCFVVDPEVYRRSLKAAGFDIEQARNRLEVAREFFRQEKLAIAKDGPRLGIHILEAPRIFTNTAHLFADGVLAPVELICRAV